MRPVTAELSVSGMPWLSPVTSLETAIGCVPGAKHVSVNLATERPMINYNAELMDLHALAQAIDDAGYQVRGFSPILLVTNELRLRGCKG